jgi:spoIIIJ-associated protein
VLARLDAPPPAPVAEPEPSQEGAEGPGAACAREVIEHVVEGLGLSASLRVAEEEGHVRVSLAGADLGLLIGRHGQTIDAVQYLANAIVHRRLGGEAPEVVVDAQGYRERRERMLHQVAVTAAVQARRTGRPVALDPMTSVERKIVHMRLKDEAGVRTASEGNDPNRYIVVLPE